jgi:hypothetical protein
MNDLSIPHDNFYRPPVKSNCLDGFLGIGERASARATKPATRRCSSWKCASTAS